MGNVTQRIDIAMHEHMASRVAHLQATLDAAANDKREPILIRSPLDLPESRSGKLQIKHRTISGSCDLVSMRETVTAGRKPCRVKLDEPLRIHQLVDDDHGVWMTDLPIELRQMWEATEDANPQGRVLVGGLGLGIMATMLSQRGNLVEIVERSDDVIELLRPHTELSSYRVVHDSIEDYIKGLKSWHFDSAFLDTWQATGEGAWWEHVFPLRRLVANRFGRQRVYCWAEDVMLGQVRRAISSGQRNWYYAGVPKRLSPSATETFLRDVGLPKWEKRYGARLDAAHNSMILQ